MIEAADRVLRAWMRAEVGRSAQEPALLLAGLITSCDAIVRGPTPLLHRLASQVMQHPDEEAAARAAIVEAARLARRRAPAKMGALFDMPSHEAAKALRRLYAS